MCIKCKCQSTWYEWQQTSFQPLTAWLSQRNPSAASFLSSQHTNVPLSVSSPAAMPFIISMLLASLNSCCNPWIYMCFAGHLFQDLRQNFLCCSARYLKSSQCRCEHDFDSSHKSNSSTFAIKSTSSQRSITQTSTTWTSTLRSHPQAAHLPVARCHRPQDIKQFNSFRYLPPWGSLFEARREETT